MNSLKKFLGQKVVAAEIGVATAVFKFEDGTTPTIRAVSALGPAHLQVSK